MSAFHLKLAALAAASVLGVTAAHAQNSYPSLFAGQTRQAAATPVRSEPVVSPPARVATNRVDLSQQGRNNGVAVGQTGIRNSAAVTQRGASNAGQISQTGVNNDATIFQLGRNNTGSITQTGDNNTACLVQLGRNNSAGITQTGDNNSIGIAQTPTRAWEFSPELCSLYGADTWSLKRQIRAVGLEGIRP
ncbi:MAG: hypothetical protein R3C46_09990 [Hyphomonadaceae bacterium]